MKKLSYEFVRCHFEQQGCQLLDHEYKNANHPMCYRCRCGCYGKTSFNNFKKCGRCTSCADCEKYTVAYIQEFFHEHGCQLLSKSYKNKNQKLEFRCKCGKIGHVSFSNFKRASHHKCCRDCWKKTFSGNNHYNWNPDREALKQKQAFHRRCCTLLWNTLQQTGQKKTGRTRALLGYSTEELRCHLMSHPNWASCVGKKWDIDHVFPVSAFVSFGVFDLKIINSLDNLQPLPKNTNLSKGGTYDNEAFVKWLLKKGVMLDNH